MSNKPKLSKRLAAAIRRKKRHDLIIEREVAKRTSERLWGWLAYIILACILGVAVALTTSCAHRDLAAREAAWKRAPNHWAEIARVHSVEPREITRVDYLAGAIYWRVERNVWSYIPLTPQALQAGAVITSRKEFLAAPALVPDLVGLGLTALPRAAGLIVVTPTFQASEELWHAYQETYWPVWYPRLRVFWYYATGGSLPGANVARAILYPLDPVELSAKVTKLAMLGHAPNMDSPAALARYWHCVGWVASVTGRAPEEVAGVIVRPTGDYWHPTRFDGVFGPTDERGEIEPRGFPFVRILR